jgi:hypothetical protein
VIADEVATLLGYLSEVDGRHKATADPQMKVRVWADMLSAVSLDFALTFARRYYAQSRDGDKMLAPGALNDAWRHAQDRERAREALAHQVQELPALLARRTPDWFAEFAGECRVAFLDGMDPDALPSPVQIRRPEPGTGEARERACGNPDCHCTHTECRAGWLDTEDRRSGMQGPKAYPVVARCPTCTEGIEMRSEVAAARRGR